MIKIYKDYKTQDILSRKIDDYGEYEGTVKEILKNVASRGDAAVKEYCQKFDGFSGQPLAASEDEFDEAEAALTVAF